MTRWKGGINKKTIITCAMDFLIITHVIYMAVHYQIQYWIGKGDLRKIEIYLSSGASSNDKFDGGYTPLIIAVMNHKESAVGLLLDYGADPNLAVDDGSTPLHFAVRTRDHEAIRILLDNGANPNLSSPMARVSPFELAIGMEDMPMVRLFVEKGAVVQRHDADRVNDSDLADYLKSKLPDA